MRLRNDPNAIQYVNNSELVIKDFPFKLSTNTTIEIGMGKGEMLVQLALENPNRFFIGIEKYQTVAVKALKKAKKLNLKNFFVICEDVSKLENKLEGEVDEIWLTFSDPWPKKRHFKRRLTYKTFLDIYKNVLSNDGILKIKTDNDDFFAWSIESIIEYGGQILFQTNNLHKSIKNENNIPTGYEIKWSGKGKNINYLEVKF